MAKTILGRKVYKFRMEPTELEALELERTASVARSIYNWRNHGETGIPTAILRL